MATHHSVLVDHQIIVDGVSMQERKDLTITHDETGLEECYLSHTRVIGDRSLTTKRAITDGEEKEESIETEMDDSELENFLIELSGKKWLRWKVASGFSVNQSATFVESFKKMSLAFSTNVS